MYHHNIQAVLLDLQEILLNLLDYFLEEHKLQFPVLLMSASHNTHAYFLPRLYRRTLAVTMIRCNNAT